MSAVEASCRYDERLGYMVIPGSSRPAVLDPEVRPRVSKKKDIEKGEDQKDLWI